MAGGPGVLDQMIHSVDRLPEVIGGKVPEIASHAWPQHSDMSWGAQAPSLAKAGAVINSEINNKSFYGTAIDDKLMAGIDSGKGINNI
jgi:nicotinamidase-related amidase